MTSAKPEDRVATLLLGPKAGDSKAGNVLSRKALAANGLDLKTIDDALRIAHRRQIEQQARDSGLTSPYTNCLPYRERVRITQQLHALRQSVADGNHNAMVVTDRLSFLPEDKAKTISSNEAVFASRIEELEVAGLSPSELHDKRRDLRLESVRLARAALTEEEYLKYVLSSNPYLIAFVESLTGFIPSREEFSALIRLRERGQEAFAYARDGVEVRGFDNWREQQKFNSELASVLGEARYQDYKAAMDYTYRTAIKVVVDSGLEDDKINWLVSAQKAFLSNVAQAHNTGDYLGAVETSAAFERDFKAQLGQDGWRKYQLYMAGPYNSWKARSAMSADAAKRAAMRFGTQPPASP